MKLDVAPVGDHLDDVAGQQRAALGPVQHLPALVVAAAADQRQAAAERRASRRSQKRTARIGPHHPLPLGLVQIDRAAERVRPLDHRGSSSAGARSRSRPAALRPSIRSTISSSRYGVQSQRTLPAALLTSSARWPIANDGVAADAEDAVVVADVGLVVRDEGLPLDPLLARVVRDVLPRVLADRAGSRAARRRRVLRRAGLAQVAWSLRRSLEQRDALDVRRVREHVDRPRAHEPVAVVVARGA